MRSGWNVAGEGELGEHGTIGGPIHRMVRPDDDVHLPPEADATDGRFERPHADARGLDRQVIAANRQEIQSNALLGI